MPDQFCKDMVYIVSKSARKYDVLQTQNGVVFKKRQTPAVLPDYVKPRPKAFTPIPPSDKVVSTIIRPNTIVAKPIKEVVPKVESPISNSSSFEDLKKKVEELRKKEAEKKLDTTSKVEDITKTANEDSEDIAVVTMEDADDLASGLISSEQELVTRDYLKSLEKPVLKKLYFICTGNKAGKDTSKYEMRKEILKVYNEASANKKKEIYDASRTSV